MRRPTLIAIIVAATLVVGVAAGAATTARFSDIEDHWARTYIEWADDNNIMSGKADGSFQPNEKVSRAQLAAYLYRLAKWWESQELTISEQILLQDINVVTIDGELYSTSWAFDSAYTWREVGQLVKSLCEAMGSAPANGTLREMRQVIPDWLESVEWAKGVTDSDKWRVVFYGYYAMCPEYESVYKIWSDADWPGLDLS